MGKRDILNDGHRCSGGSALVGSARHLSRVYLGTLAVHLVHFEAKLVIGNGRGAQRHVTVVGFHLGAAVYVHKAAINLRNVVHVTCFLINGKADQAQRYHLDDRLLLHSRLIDVHVYFFHAIVVGHPIIHGRAGGVPSRAGH